MSEHDKNKTLTEARQNEESYSDVLLPCPCGKVPSRLIIVPGSSCKWAWASGDCCTEWNIEFRTGYAEINSKQCYNEAVKYWNDVKRA